MTFEELNEEYQRVADEVSRKVEEDIRNANREILWALGIWVLTIPAIFLLCGLVMQFFLWLNK